MNPSLVVLYGSIIYVLAIVMHVLSPKCRAEAEFCKSEKQFWNLIFQIVISGIALSIFISLSSRDKFILLNLAIGFLILEDFAKGDYKIYNTRVENNFNEELTCLPLN